MTENQQADCVQSRQAGFVRYCLILKRIVCFVADRLAPFITAVFAGAFYCNVAEPAVLLGTVPVLDLRRNGNDHARFQFHSRLALFLIPALAGSADQDLSAAFGGVVNVPVVPAARLKGHVGQKDGTGAGRGQRL